MFEDEIRMPHLLLALGYFVKPDSLYGRNLFILMSFFNLGDTQSYNGIIKQKWKTLEMKSICINPNGFTSCNINIIDTLFQLVSVIVGI